MAVLWFLLGAAIVAITVLDVFQVVIVPRPTGRRYRPSGFIVPRMWRAWKAFGDRFISLDGMEDYLGAFAPTALSTLLVFWIGSLIVGYGFVFYALRDWVKPEPGLFASMYFAGTSLLTIGYGDYEPIGDGARLLSLAAGGSGLASFAILTTFLFAIFGAYQQREAFVVMFTNRAGAPPSAVDLIETHSALNTIEDLVRMLRESELWMAQVLETHLAYPILTYFRSTHDDISWIAVVGTVLDASTIAISSINVKSASAALIANRMGRHLVRDFARYFPLPIVDGVGIERGEFDAAYERLQAVGVPLVERDRAWEDFAAIRSTYASAVNEMARYWRIPPARWIGDRSALSHAPPFRLAAEDRSPQTRV